MNAILPVNVSDLRVVVQAPDSPVAMETLLHSLASDAAMLRDLLPSPANRDFLIENISFVEEAFDQLRAALDVLNRNHA